MALCIQGPVHWRHCPECGDPIMKDEEVSYAADKSLLHAECNPASTYDDGWDEDDD